MKILLTFFCFCCAANLSAQNIYIYAEQELNFGDFYVSNNSSGTVEVSHTGAWTSSGNVHLLKATHRAAVFIISTDSAVPIHVRVESFAQKLRNHDGSEIFINLHAVEPSVYKIQEGSPVQVRVGGDLKITSEALSSSGNYSGSISISVNIYNE